MLLTVSSNSRPKKAYFPKLSNYSFKLISSLVFLLWCFCAAQRSVSVVNLMETCLLGFSATWSLSFYSSCSRWLTSFPQHWTSPSVFWHFIEQLKQKKELPVSSRKKINSCSRTDVIIWTAVLIYTVNSVKHLNLTPLQMTDSTGAALKSNGFWFRLPSYLEGLAECGLHDTQNTLFASGA